MFALLVPWAQSLTAQSYRRIDLPGSTLTIGGSARLSRIGGIAAAPGAGVSISQPEVGVVLHYDGTGKLLHRFGGDSGFKRLDRHGWHGASIWVNDLTDQKVLVLDAASGRVSNTIELQRYVGIAKPIAMTPDGMLIVDGHFRNSGVATRQFSFRIAVIGTFGPASPRVLTELPEECATRTGTRWVSQPWCQKSLGAVAPSGEWIAAVFPAGDSDATRTTVRVTFIGVRGDTLRSMRTGAPALAVPADRRRPELEAAQSEGQGAGSAAPRYPIAAAVFATNDRTVWLAQETDTGWRYIVLNTDGREVGRYATASNLQLMAAAGRSAFGVRTLTSGQQQVVRVTF